MKGEPGFAGRDGMKGDKGETGPRGERGDTPNCPKILVPNELRGDQGQKGDIGLPGNYFTFYYICHISFFSLSKVTTEM